MNPFVALLFLLAFAVFVAAVEEYRDWREDRRIARWREAIGNAEHQRQREEEAFRRYWQARDAVAAKALLRQAGITGGEIPE